MTIQRLLVFGATGTQGHPVVEAAVEAGFEVRAACRDLQIAEEQLPGRVDKVAADLLDAEQVRAAVAGTDALFFHLPTMPNLPESTRIVDNVLAASRAEGLERIVFTTSGYCGEAMPPGPFVSSMRRLCERLLSSDQPVVILRPSLYLANLVWPHIIREIRDHGRLSYPPLPVDHRISWTATEDQGRVAVACLTADVVGEELDIASPEALTGPELGQLLAEVYRREVHFAPVASDAFVSGLSQLTGSAHTATVIASVYEGYASVEGGLMIGSDMLERRLGVKLTPVSHWVRNRLGYLLDMYS